MVEDYIIVQGCVFCGQSGIVYYETVEFIWC